MFDVSVASCLRRLQDLGVVALGDILAILKQAKAHVAQQEKAHRQATNQSLHAVAKTPAPAQPGSNLSSNHAM